MAAAKKQLRTSQGTSFEPKITVDQTCSSTSTNPVSGKAVVEYVAEAIAGQDVIADSVILGLFN